MSTIQYLIKVEPYEVKMSFGGSQIKDTKEAKIEFDISQLNEEQLELWIKEKPLFNTLRLQTHELNDASLYLVPKPFVADRELTLDEAFEALSLLNASRAALKTTADNARRRREEEARQRALQIQVEREAKAEADRLAAIEAVKAAAAFDFNERGVCVTNLYERLLIVSEVEQDDRFSSNWIKRVTAVDFSQPDGYSFVGDWLRNRSVEVASGEKALFIVAGTSGSRKHNTTEYVVVTLQDNRLTKTDIRATNEDEGWALVIRDRVAQLLKELES